MGGEETLWRDAYEEQFCYDCLNFECERSYPETVTCQWRKAIKMIEEYLNLEDKK